MLGVGFDSLVLGFITYKMYRSRHNFCMLRAFIKASLLGLATFSPIYIFFAAVFVDLICMVVEYCIGHKYHNKYPKIWVAKHLALNLSLCLLVLDPEIKLTIILASVLIGLTVLADIVTHIQEYRQRGGDFEQLEISEKNSATQEVNIWDINFDKSEKGPKNTLQEGEMTNTKTTFINTRNSSFGSDYISRRNKFKRNRGEPKPDVLRFNGLREQDEEDNV